MKSKKTNSYKWVYLPVVFSSAAVLFTPAMAGQYQTEDVQQVGSLNHQFVGGRTQVGVSITDDGSASADVNHIFSETQDSATSGGLWAGFDLEGDDKGIDSGGVQLNHNWVSRDGQGRATYVNKAFVAYDRNSTDDAKVTVGYGQERENLFWEGHVSKGLSDKRLVKEATHETAAVYEKAFDYGVGGSVGTFLTGTNTRVRGGLDYQWGTETGAGEEDAKMLTVSAGVEQYFSGTPHSVALDVAASKKEGGYEFEGSDEIQTSASLSYRYDFGGDNIYQPDQRYRRVRVEVPGKGRAATYAKKPIYTKKPIYKTQPVYKNQPIYKKQPIYVNKTVRVPTQGHMAKSTVELEGQTFFKYGSAVLIPSAQQRLRQIANEIRKHGYKGNIRITGHTCGLPDPVKDRALSQQRANAVKHFLVSQGFNPAHLDTRGLGSSQPKFSKADQDFKNRRVDIEYVTERQQRVAGGFRNETRKVQNGFKNVITGYKRVQVGTKNVQVGVRNVQTGTTDILVSQGAPGTPRVIWRTEPVDTAPAWITRALRSNLSHNRTVDTYLTTASSGGSVEIGNSAPNAINDTTKIEVNQTVLIDVVFNDIDVDGDALTIVSVSEGSAGGTISFENNKILYTPAVNFVGTETFTYTISDGSKTSTATVSVTVSASTDGGGDNGGGDNGGNNGGDNGGNNGGDGTNSAPKAVDDSATTNINTAKQIHVLGNDSDAENDSISITSVTQGLKGGTVEIQSGGKVLYTPATGFTGKDTFTYTITAGGQTSTATVMVDVKAVNASDPCNCTVANMDDVLMVKDTVAVIDVLANDTGDSLSIIEVSQGHSGTVKITGDKVTYTPNANFVGNDFFWYAIKSSTGDYKTSNKVMVYVDGSK